MLNTFGFVLSMHMVHFGTDNGGDRSIEEAQQDLENCSEPFMMSSCWRIHSESYLRCTKIILPETMKQRAAFGTSWNLPNGTPQTLKSLPKSVKFVLREPKEQRPALHNRKRCPVPPWRRPRDAGQTLKRLSKTGKDGPKHVQSRGSVCKPVF